MNTIDDATDGMLILFVDDEEKSRKYFKIIFGRGRNVVVANDGVHALEILNQDHSGRIGVIVTDQIMPRMTGIEMLRLATERNPYYVRVLSTAYTDSELVANAVKNGLIDYFVGKPWSIQKLGEIIESATLHYRHVKQSRRNCDERPTCA
ncbi:MAG: response regulator [Gloeobacteraceae cyanobacterium ES-bin-144]|nr:response regulator [Verrucomicrobiales bacterium]